MFANLLIAKRRKTRNSQLIDVDDKYWNGILHVSHSNPLLFVTHSDDLEKLGDGGGEKGEKRACRGGAGVFTRSNCSRTKEESSGIAGNVLLLLRRADRSLEWRALTQDRLLHPQ